jgi:hypothetical protein
VILNAKSKCQQKLRRRAGKFKKLRKEDNFKNLVEGKESHEFMTNRGREVINSQILVHTTGKSHEFMTQGLRGSLAES